MVGAGEFRKTQCTGSMACLTCLRRSKQCDDLRPRCSQCKSSHLRCAYDRPPRVLRFLNEYVGPVDRRGDAAKIEKSTPSETLEDGITNLIPARLAFHAQITCTRVLSCLLALAFTLPR